jgi:glycine/D-amino acid oxidase-like deaminating enzyme
MIARTLSCQGLDVVVLDKRDVGLGSTSASTALVLYEIDTSLIKLSALFGRTKAIKYYRRCFDSIGQLLGGRCQFHRRPSLYLASRRAHLTNLKKEFTARTRAGFKVDFLTESDIEKKF